jgi:hypothetical protein
MSQGPTEPPFQFVQSFSQELCGRDVLLVTHPFLVHMLSVGWRCVCASLCRRMTVLILLTVYKNARPTLTFHIFHLACTLCILDTHILLTAGPIGREV